jgi:hypothetical protein
LVTESLRACIEAGLQMWHGEHDRLCCFQEPLKAAQALVAQRAPEKAHILKCLQNALLTCCTASNLTWSALADGALQGGACSMLPDWCNSCYGPILRRNSVHSGLAACRCRLPSDADGVLGCRCRLPAAAVAVSGLPRLPCSSSLELHHCCGLVITAGLLLLAFTVTAARTLQYCCRLKGQLIANFVASSASEVSASAVNMLSGMLMPTCVQLNRRLHAPRLRN